MAKERKFLVRWNERERSMLERVSDALKELPDFYIFDNSTNRAILDALNSIYAPQRNTRMYHGSDEEGNDYGYRNYDPTPENSFERACSGMNTYHISPLSKYFKMGRANFMEADLEGKEDLDVDHALSRRTKTIHNILQEVKNFQVATACNRDKLRLGIAVKTVEEDVARVSGLRHFPPEDIALTTSNMLDLDVFGIREKLNRFRAKRRFSNPVWPDYWTDVTSLGLKDSTEKTYHRFNMPVHVLREHIRDKVAGEFRDIELNRFMDKLGLKKQSQANIATGFTQWADIGFDEDGKIMFVETKNNHPIIISMMSPPFRITSFCRGQAEKALPLTIMLTEIQMITLAAIERTFAPPWSVVDDIQRLGMNFGRDGVIIKNREDPDPVPLSLGVDPNGIAEIKRLFQAAHDRMFYIDVFELTHKSRMTTPEVDIRSQQDISKLSFYLVQDQYDDLNPTVLTVNQHLHDRIKSKDRLAKTTLMARYVSALAFASNHGILVKFEQLVRAGQSVSGILKENTELNDKFDYLTHFKDTVSEMGEELLIRDAKDAENRVTRRIGAEKISYLVQQANALRNTAGAMAPAAGGVQEGGQGAQEGTTEQGGQPSEVLSMPA